MIKHNKDLPQKLVEMLNEDSFVIFLFHGVIKNSKYEIRNYNQKHMESNLFAECIKVLKDNGKSFSMNDLLDPDFNKKNLPPKSFAITFDDGFENNLSIAAPILYDFNIPATIYITTEFIEKNAMSWIDRIEFVLENTSSKTIYAHWLNKKIDIINNQTKINFLNSVRNFVKNSPDCNPNTFANDLCEQNGYPNILSSDDPIDKKMSWKQVSEANKSDLITIGGHSHTHSILSYLGTKQLNYEIDKSLELLDKKADVQSLHYSYPEGLEHCYSDNVINELKKRGVRCCPTAISGTNNALDDLFYLKRIMI